MQTSCAADIFHAAWLLHMDDGQPRLVLHWCRMKEGCSCYMDWHNWHSCSSCSPDSRSFEPLMWCSIHERLLNLGQAWKVEFLRACWWGVAGREGACGEVLCSGFKSLWAGILHSWQFWRELYTCPIDKSVIEQVPNLIGDTSVYFKSLDWFVCCLCRSQSGILIDDMSRIGQLTQ